ncbi:MAG: D-alanyl-D-alanine carboxypeptidase/D-alanyl-D-alanine-endopeptidase [Gammaproteobacteria bacterium]|jgi:D-alanyl-D-alanine carboxypeptidase/D-alanyl-D-alanine-endopeptidase (penicillin-binding protein 4)
MHASVLFLLVLSGPTLASAADATADSIVESTADAMVDPAAPAAVLPPRVQAVLDGHDLDRDGLSIVVQGVEEPKPILSLNPEVSRSPASIIKLLTSFAALDMLGPAYTWKTRAYLGGELVDGRLAGDLTLQGGGDPYLTTERFWSFLRDLRARGLRDIDGDLVIDNSYFDVDSEDPGSFDGQPFRTYNVSPDALLINLKAVEFRIYRPSPGARPRVVTDPVIADLEIDNRIRTAQGPCRGFQRGVAIDLPSGLEGNTVQLSGRFPSGCTEYSLWRTVMKPPEFAYGVFEPLWRELGGNLAGKVRTGPAPEDAEPFARAESVPLAEVVRNVNKFSNNVMTRQLLLTLGAEQQGEPGDRIKGRAAINRWLADQGLEMPELHLDNGSGLSRETRIAAASMADMLRVAWQHRYMPEFIASMPLSGMDGTLRNRFRSTILAGQLHGKTGRLDHVYSLAGYVQAASGKRYVVVVIQNDHDVHRGPGRELQDALLSWVFRQ